MPLYNVKFEIINHTADRTAEASEPISEKVLAANRSFAQLEILKKYKKDGKNQIRFLDFEILYLPDIYH